MYFDQLNEVILYYNSITIFIIAVGGTLAIIGSGLQTLSTVEPDL